MVLDQKHSIMKIIQPGLTKDHEYEGQCGFCQCRFRCKFQETLQEEPNPDGRSLLHRHAYCPNSECGQMVKVNIIYGKIPLMNLSIETNNSM
jgi:hypothetical protein